MGPDPRGGGVRARVGPLPAAGGSSHGQWGTRAGGGGTPCWSPGSRGVAGSPVVSGDSPHALHVALMTLGNWLVTQSGTVEPVPGLKKLRSTPAPGGESQ